VQNESREAVRSERASCFADLNLTRDEARLNCEILLSSPPLRRLYLITHTMLSSLFSSALEAILPTAHAEEAQEVAEVEAPEASEDKEEEAEEEEEEEEEPEDVSWTAVYSVPLYIERPTALQTSAL
jgi:hypothetical protein